MKFLEKERIKRKNKGEIMPVSKSGQSAGKKVKKYNNKLLPEASALTPVPESVSEVPDNAAGLNQSIERSLRLLSVLGASQRPMNVTEISRALGVSRSTAYSIIRSMLSMGFLEKYADDKSYFMGYQVFVLGSIYRVTKSYAIQCDEYMIEFLRHTPQKITRLELWTMQPDHRILKFLVKTAAGSRALLNDNNRAFPAYSSAPGKILLSALPEPELRAALRIIDYRPFTNHTITSEDLLLRELATIRTRGYSIDIEEFINFNVNAAALVRNQNGNVVGAINIAVPKMLYMGNEQNYIDMITGLGQELSSLLGYQP